MQARALSCAHAPTCGMPAARSEAMALPKIKWAPTVRWVPKFWSWLKSAKGQRLIAVVALVGSAVIAVVVRYVLFQSGALYGEAAAKMASLAVAGFIVVCGYLPLRMLRGTSNSQASGGATESIVATVAAILGLALTAYSVSELLAPNTPVAASAPACAGVPVYGARYYAVTSQTGVNARSGPGRQYHQVNRYAGGCTMGFDGYCIGSAEPDFILNTPDQRWLLVHDRDELVSAAVVLSQSPESALGDAPRPECAGLGGLPQPQVITEFAYNAGNGDLTASAAGAVAVGYGIAIIGTTSRDRYHVGTLGTDAGSGFAGKLSPAQITDDLSTADGQVLLGAAICIADNVPVIGSLRARILTIDNSRIIRDVPTPRVPPAITPLLAEVACNSTR
jgi:hypothetical protein